ncbi:MAG: glycerophosphodiester phosphodiesterase [Candidatus Symbiothrix sp.]|nr:glycerophosphodiester phosphodiesterase [Candidatus Symbiothrix sp.]
MDRKKIIVLTVIILLFSLCDSPETTDFPKIIAHRGYWQAEGSAQNSLTSLRKAQESGVYGSEFDVWLTLDGKLVVNHDPVIQEISIQDASYEQIKNLTLSNGEKLPTLEDYLKQGKATPSVKLILEIKTHKNLERNMVVTAAVVNQVSISNMSEQVEYIAGNIDVCKELLRLQPMAKVAYMTSNPDYTLQELKDMGITGIDYYIGWLRTHPKYITQAHQLGLTVNVWTVNDLSVMLEMADFGVDYVTTDQPWGGINSAKLR